VLRPIEFTPTNGHPHFHCIRCKALNHPDEGLCFRLFRPKSIHIFIVNRGVEQNEIRASNIATQSFVILQFIDPPAGPFAAPGMDAEVVPTRLVRLVSVLVSMDARHL
jgi:hypothetical protein